MKEILYALSMKTAHLNSRHIQFAMMLLTIGSVIILNGSPVGGGGGTPGGE